tara:strand:- start:273 stop:893 length:621 start_codon:yes stop_codon:yes gene_type:complete
MNYNKYKVILIGDSGIGKTTIMNSYLKKNNINPVATIGTEYVNIKFSKYNQDLQIWDCAGQEKFRSLVKLYYREAKACIFTFDLTRKKTLDSINNYWIKNVKDNADENCVFLLVGNKSDLEKNTNYNLINDLCKKYNMEYVETSAIKNINVTNIFSNISDILYAKYILNKKNNYIYDLTYNQNILTINDEETNNKDKFNRYIYSYC